MYRELKGHDGRQIGEVEGSITVNKSLPELKEFLLSVDHANDILGQHFELEAAGKGSFSWTFDAPLPFPLAGRGTISMSTPTTILWKAQDADNRAMELKLELTKSGHGTKVFLTCLFDRPGKALAALLIQALRNGPDALVRSMLGQMKRLAEAQPHGLTAMH